MAILMSTHNIYFLGEIRKVPVFVVKKSILYGTNTGDYVCVEVLRPSQPIGVRSSMVSLPNHTSTGQA